MPFCVCVFYTERGPRFLNRHAEGLRQLQKLLPEEMNATDGKEADTQGLSRLLLLLFYFLLGGCMDFTAAWRLMWHGVGCHLFS